MCCCVMVRGVGFQQVELCVLLCYGEGGGLSAGGALCCCVMVRGVGFQQVELCVVVDLW